MRYVLDASVALKWCLNEDNIDKARKLREEYRRGVHELMAPDIFPAEIGHALSRAQRQRKITDEQASFHFADILSTPPKIIPSASLLSQAFQLAIEARTRFYDCLYIVLAEEQGCEVLTADQKLIKTFQGAPIVDLSSL